jgi:hypothetical protein
MRSLRIVVLVSTGLMLMLANGARGQAELSYQQYRALAWAADRMDHLAMYEPVHGEAGMYLVLADRFSTVQVIKLDARGAQREWKSKQLSGIPEEVGTGDLDGDGLEDSIICRTSGGKVYVWNMDGYNLVWESLQGDYQQVASFTVANVDDDPQQEIITISDGILVYYDGVSFNKDWTSLDQYEASMVRAGDVDGDGRMEIVLNSGQVLDAISGTIEWEEEPFFQIIELLDIDGDGMPEVLTENGFGGPLKVYDMDYGNEVRFQ